MPGFIDFYKGQYFDMGYRFAKRRVTGSQKIWTILEVVQRAIM
jgi:hypothetical protein